jgi:hypothetical protein
MDGDKSRALNHIQPWSHIFVTSFNTKTNIRVDSQRHFVIPHSPTSFQIRLAQNWNGADMSVLLNASVDTSAATAAAFAETNWITAVLHCRQITINIPASTPHQDRSE